MEGKEKLTGSSPQSTDWDDMLAELNELNQLTGHAEVKLVKTEEKQETEIIDAAKILEELNELNRITGHPEMKISNSEESEQLKLEEEEQLALEEQRLLAKEESHQLLTEEELAEEQFKNIEEEAEKQRTKDIAQIMSEENPSTDPAKVDLPADEPAINEPAAETVKHTPLVAINADWLHDKREMAHDLAEQALNKEVSEGNFIKRIWKGTLFKKYFEQKYTQEYMSGDRTDEQGRTIVDLIREQKPSVIERFTLGILENDRRYVHEKAGEKLVPADEKTNEEVKYAIEQYARYKLKLGDKISDLDREFKNQMGFIMQSAIDDGRIGEGAKYTNYLDIAKKAATLYEEAINRRGKAEHDAAMAEVMAGFQVYNAEVRNGVRTAAHRDNIDKIVNKLESSKIGRFIPAEILAGAAGAATALTQTGARAIFGAAGGILASSAISGLKERNRITEDRTRMMRDVANGMKYGANKRTAKYEKELGGTIYDMQEATSLTANLEAAIDSIKNSETEDSTLEYNLLYAMAEARVRIDFSDSEQKDLISYSSPDKRGRERLDLDIALIKAEKHLNEGGLKMYKIMRENLKNRLIEGYEDESGEYHVGVKEQDEDFKNIRTIAAIKKAGKTLALGSAIFFGSQEIMAAIDPGKIGIFEKAGLLKTENDTEAKETILASALGGRGRYTMPGEPNIETYKNISDPNAVKRYEAAGFSKTETSAAWSEPQSNIVDVDPTASTARVSVRYDGWAANGTKTSGIRSAIVDGRFVSRTNGSAVVDGQTINYDPNAVKGYLTVGDAKFEIAGSLDESGQLVWSDNGVFTTTTGETIKAIGDNGEKLYKYFEIATDNGVDAEGVQHIIPLATDVGANTFSDKIQQVVTETIEHPATYTFTKIIPSSNTFIRDISFNGIAFAPETARTSLGAARERQELIGGAEGISIMTDTEPLTPINVRRYNEWWNSLSEEGKNIVRDTVNQINSSDDRYNLDWGNGFRTWFAAMAK